MAIKRWAISAFMLNDIVRIAFDVMLLSFQPLQVGVTSKLRFLTDERGDMQHI